MIKSFLNQIFTKNKTNSLEKTDLHLAITYLLKRSFSNQDLLKIIATNNPELYIYISTFCTNQNVPMQFMERLNIYSTLKISNKSSKLYFLYLIELSKKNYFNAFAYYKTYFDSMTAEFDHYVIPNQKNGKNRRINYKGFYKIEQLKNFYNFDIKDKHTIIDEAHKLRNENPLNHSSAKLLTGDKAIKNEITKVISKLEYLLQNKIKELSN